MQQKPLGYIVIRSDGVVIDKNHNVVLFQDKEVAVKMSGGDGRIWPVVWDQNEPSDEPSEQENIIVMEPCPRCGMMYAAGEYKPQPSRKPETLKGMPFAPDDIDCQCGAKLRHSVPMFKVNASGWYWKIL